MNQTVRMDQTVRGGKTAFAIMDAVPDRSAQLPSKRVEEDLRARIARAEWKSGERLPPVAELAAQYGVARSTVVAAERRIAEDELIEIVPNWGVFRR